MLTLASLRRCRWGEGGWGLTKGSPRSPYREMGLRAQDVLREPEKRRKPTLTMIKLNARASLPKTRHRWSMAGPRTVLFRVPFPGVKRHRAGALGMDIGAAVCTRCGQPRFAVDGQPCKARGGRWKRRAAAAAVS